MEDIFEFGWGQAHSYWSDSSPSACRPIKNALVVGCVNIEKFGKKRCVKELSVEFIYLPPLRDEPFVTKPEAD
tara:strand:+ start:372 stop:590 length:219 start_codon:yes stop_codon:yes gene_type:complete